MENIELLISEIETKVQTLIEANQKAKDEIAQLKDENQRITNDFGSKDEVIANLRKENEELMTLNITEKEKTSELKNKIGNIIEQLNRSMGLNEQQ